MASGRKSSNGKSGLTVTLSVSPSKLREVYKDMPAKEDSPASPDAEASDTKEKAATPPEEANESPRASGQPATQASGENVSDSNPGTPAPGGTPGPMGPPGKKGTKRGATNGEPKSRGKPGPKKRARVDDGTGEPVTGRGSAAHKLGPKANLGAINAGLRALDRSGKPCRKWQKGGFRLKTFTGAVWEIPRWKAPQKAVVEEKPEGDSADVSATGSVKDNKDEAQAKTDDKSDSKSGAGTPNGVVNGDAASGQDVEMQSAPSIPESSPAPVPVAAA